MTTQNKTESKGLLRFLAQKCDITKKKVLSSLLAAFAPCFFVFIYSTTSVYFSNAEELSFSFMDFAPLYIFGFCGMFCFLFLLLLITKKLLQRILFSLVTGFTVCAYVQSFVTTLTFSGLPGDGMSDPPSKQKIIINLAVWIVALAVFGISAFFRKKTETTRTALSLLLIAVTLMQIFSLIPSAITYISSKDSESNKSYFLTTEDQLNLSSQENIIVLVLDSFDREYLLEYLASDSEAMNEFDGFTYYDDNIASYPRTFPGCTSMVSGIINDFSLNREAYFTEAYSTSPFLKDLKANDYKVNLYIPIYYTYSNADILAEYVSNVSVAEGYKITAPFGLFKRMFSLSSYFWLPEKAKSPVISTSTFQEIGAFVSDKSMYEVENHTDPTFYKELKSQGLTANDNQKVFTFMHLRGCHPPFRMNENCEEVAANTVTSLQQTTGCFNIIKEYLRQMKALGIYENSTIIITGDHAGPYAWSDNLTEYEQPMNTALLVKPKGAQGTQFTTSKAPVSQENLLAEIVKSANIKTTHDYGKAYSDISEDEDTVRKHYFITFTGSKRKDELVTYEIIGDGTNFDNWEIVSREHIGAIYD